MISLTEVLKNLITLDDVIKLSAEDIIEQISIRLYEKENSHLRDNEVFSKMPTVLKDIILIIDFDTELNMNGILGFLENSTGLFLDETILALERIRAFEDFIVLKKIKDILRKYRVSTHDLRENVNKGDLSDISSFSKTHGAEYDEMTKAIGVEAEKLYLYNDFMKIFDYLTEYVEKSKTLLQEDLIKL